MISSHDLRSKARRLRLTAKLPESRMQSALEDNAYYAEYSATEQAMWRAVARLLDPAAFLVLYAQELENKAQSIEDYRDKRDKEMARMTIASRERYRQILSHDADIDHACGPDCAGNPDYQYERQVGK